MAITPPPRVWPPSAWHLLIETAAQHKSENTFGRSVDAVMPLEISITHMPATNEAEKKKSQNTGDDERSDNRTMGRKRPKASDRGQRPVRGHLSTPV